MDAVLTQRIELARIEARRRGHHAVEPEHLLAAIVDAAEVSRALRGRGLDPIELRERVEARLSAEPALAGYRDGNQVALSPALERIIESLSARRWLGLGAPITYVDALLPEPSIATLVFGLRRGNDHRHILERAAALAVISAHASVGIAHVFRVLLDLRSFVETLERAEADLERLRETIDAALAALAKSLTPSQVARIDPVVRRVVSSVSPSSRRSGAPIATVRQLCLALARQEEAEPFWTAAGIECSAFVRAVHIPDAPR